MWPWILLGGLPVGAAVALLTWRPLKRFGKGVQVERARELFMLQRERHLRCNPTTAQFIVDPNFPPVTCTGAFAKDKLDPKYVADEEARITRGWRRLQEIPALHLATIQEYPLPEVIAGWQAASGEEKPPA